MCKYGGSLDGLVSISHKRVGMVEPLLNGGVAAPLVTWSQTRCMHFDRRNYRADQKDSRRSSLQKAHSVETTSLCKAAEKE